MGPQLKAVPDDRTSRQPPANLEAERAAIGCVLIKQELLPELADLHADDFYLPAHRVIWEAIRALQEAGKTIDSITLGDEMRVRGTMPRLEGGEGYLMVCADQVPHAESSGHYAGIIRQKSSLRKAIHLFSNGLSQAYAGEAIDTVLEFARSGIADLELAGPGEGPVKVGDAMTPVIEMLEMRAKDPEKFFVHTGIGRFDRYFGGLAPERLITVAAPPGLGKSAWASTVLVNAAFNGVPAVLFSVEMGRQELIERMLAGHSKISTKAYSTGEVARDAQSFSRNVYPSARALAKLPLWVDDREYLTIGQLVASIRRWYAKHVGSVPPKDQPPIPAIVAVDYLQLLASDNSDDDDDRNKAIGKMTRALKRLSKSLRIPIVGLSQLSRAWDKGGAPRKFKLSDLRDSGSIEQDSDMVIFIWREPPKDSDGNEMRNTSGEAEWIAAKNRGGPTGFIRVYWHAEFTRFENLDPSDNDPRLPYAD